MGTCPLQLWQTSHTLTFSVSWQAQAGLGQEIEKVRVWMVQSGLPDLQWASCHYGHPYKSQGKVVCSDMKIKAPPANQRLCRAWISCSVANPALQ